MQQVWGKKLIVWPVPVVVPIMYHTALTEGVVFSVSAALAE
jgi:hypothetical protein